MTRIQQAVRLREAVVPGWLEEVVQLRPAPVPWADMIRAVIALCVPLSVAIAAGQRALGLLIAMAGLLGTVTDPDGAYALRAKWVARRRCSAGQPASPLARPFMAAAGLP